MLFGHWRDGTLQDELPANLPFPKTRRIVFLNNQPATLPGWAELKIDEYG